MATYNFKVMNRMEYSVDAESIKEAFEKVSKVFLLDNSKFELLEIFPW